MPKSNFLLEFENEEDKVQKLENLAKDKNNDWKISKNKRLYKESVHHYGGKNLRRYKCNFEESICMRMAYKQSLCRKHLNMKKEIQNMKK